MKNIIINNYRICVILLALAGLNLVSCKKIVEVSPPATSITSASVYASDATAIAVMTGVYAGLSSTSAMNVPQLSLFSGLSADEFILWSGVANDQLFSYFTNRLSVSGNLSYGSEFWNGTYPYIFICNGIIGGLTNNTLLTPSVANQLLGEAKFVRAYLFFYLVNLYGDIPLPLGTDYTINAKLPRVSKDVVYQQLISDLKDAKSLLSSTYLDGSLLKVTTERVRPTNCAASALLARVYLYNGNWSEAETESSNVINNSSYGLVDLNSVFLKNNKEAIWQLQPVIKTYTNVYDAYQFILPSTGPNSNLNPVYLNSNLVNSFELNDGRFANWIDSVSTAGVTYYYPNKYKVNVVDASVSEYWMLMRLGEQYLIRAEARAQKGDLNGGEGDLKIVRQRAGLGGTTASGQKELLGAIMHERQVELFTELGHRWMDLKRTGGVDSVMSKTTPEKGGTWRSTQQLYPLPVTDLKTDNSLIQNPGY